MVGLVHLVQRFTVPFASHTRARIIRCESPPLCPHHWSFLTAYPTLYKFHLRLRFPTDRISESASAKWKRRQWRDPIGLEFLLLFVGEAKRESPPMTADYCHLPHFPLECTPYILRACVWGKGNGEPLYQVYQRTMEFRLYVVKRGGTIFYSCDHRPSIVIKRKIFLLHLQPINKNNTEKRHWTNPETSWGKDNSIERPCASGNGAGKPMLHLPAWDVASLSVACPKVWRTLRSPNKSQEHQPAAKAAGRVWKIQTTVKDRKLT